jgi:hypothetical protein
MEPNDIVRALNAKINEAEAAYTAADALASDEFRLLFDPAKMQKAEVEYEKLMRRALAFRKTLTAVLETAGFPRPRTGC